MEKFQSQPARATKNDSEPRLHRNPALVLKADREYRTKWGEDAELLVFQGANEFWSLFDVTGWEHEAPGKPVHRVVATWGTSKPDSRIGKRSRLRRFPLPTKRKGQLDRGHLVALASGGGEDVNIVPQAFRLNRGWNQQGRQWRRLERLCASNPGAFLFIRVTYDDLTDIPSALEFTVETTNGHSECQRFENFDN